MSVSGKGSKPIMIGISQGRRCGHNLEKLFIADGSGEAWSTSR